MTRSNNRDHGSAFKVKQYKQAYGEVNQYKQAYGEGGKTLSVIDIPVFEDFLKERDENPSTHKTFRLILH